MLFFSVVSLFIITDSYKAVAEEGGGAQVPEKVTIAYNVGNPPLKFADSDGRAAGILIDLWRLWSEKSGVEVEFREAVFSKTLDMVKNGEADVHAGLFYTRERDRFLDYSEPLMDISYHIFHRKGLPSIDIIGDSIPYRIGVPKGYTHTFVQENQPNGAIALYENFPALYDAAVAEEIVVFLSPPINFEYYLQTRGLRNNFRYNPAKPVYRRIYLGAVAEGKKALLDTVNKGFARISQEERVAIERRWLKRSRGQTSQDQYVIACDSDYAPFTMLNVQGEPAGLFVAIWKKWAEYENVKVDFLFDDWNGSIEAVKEGLADFHAGFEADQSWQLSSSPFYRLSAKVFVPVENGINTMEDLRGRSVAAVDPFYGEILKDHPSGSHIQTINVHNYSELFNKLSTKEVDAFIDDELVVENLLLRQGRQGEFGSLPDFSYSSAISAVTRKENISLVELVNKGLNRISHEDYLLMENRWLKDSADGYYHGAGSQVELTEEESRWLQEHPVLRIGVDQGYAPYAFVDGNGNFSGIAADFTKLISDLLGIKMEMVPGLSWPDILQGAEDKTLDVLTTASWRPERESFLNFSEGYIPTPLAIMSRKGDQSIRSKNDLVGKRVALVTEYTTSKMVLTDFPDLEVLSVTTPLEGLQAVATGRVDAYVGVLGINIYQANKNGIYNLKVAASYSQVNNIIQRYGVRKDWPQLAVIIDKALATISEKEKLAIFDRWIPVGEAQRLTRPTVVLNREEQKFIEEHPTIRLGFDPEFFPFEFRGNDGSYSGIASDYITILRQRLGLNIEIVPDLSWKEAVKKIKTREIDMLPCIGKTGAREEYLAFSKPYINFQRVVIARSDFPFIGRLDDLSPFQVAVQENSSHAGFIRDNTKITPVEYPTLQDSLRAVSNREVDAFIGNLSSATYWIRKLNLTNLKVAAPAQVEKQNLYFGVRKDWPQLADIINKGLASISTDEETAIYRKWVSVKYEPGLAPGVLKEYILK
ncbi:MAG: transporter substrate-binding domain-containing protein, partial [Thermodesulfobacteriota bacterium]